MAIKLPLEKILLILEDMEKNTNFQDQYIFLSFLTIDNCEMIQND